MKVFFLHFSSYIIIAPRVVRPAEKIRINVNIMNKLWTELTVRSLIYTNEQEIVSRSQECTQNMQNTVAMIVRNIYGN